jgi:arylsulfatase A-like enzyme
MHQTSTTRRQFVAQSGALASVRKPDRRPNVLFILVDEWSPVATEPPASKRMVRTPVTDALTEGGLSFRKSYCAYPVCSPSRASLFTGRMPHEHGIFQNVSPGVNIVPATIPTMGEVFSAAGYDTGYFGKEHTGGAAYRGIKSFGSTRFERAGTIASGAALDPLFTRDGIDFMHAPRTSPFLAVVSLINPHDICMVPFGDRPPGPPPVDVPRPGTPGAGPALYKSMVHITDAFNAQRGTYLRGDPLPPLPPNYNPRAPEAVIRAKGDYYPPFKDYRERDWQLYLATYYLLIENTDWLIGRLLDSLRASGLERDTIIVFTSDHGDHMAAHQLPSKSTFYEESVRVPFVFSWKGVIKPGQVDHSHLVSGTDLLPTLCDYAGIAAPPNLAGRSLRPLAEQRSVTWREYVVSELSNARMVRTATHKYIRYAGEPAPEFLFDIEKDSGETQDLTGVPEGRDALAKCRELLDRWMKETGGTFQSTRMTEEVRRRFRGV